MIHEQLKTRQRKERDAYPPNLSLRVHRALSWLDRAERLAARSSVKLRPRWVAELRQTRL